MSRTNFWALVREICCAVGPLVLGLALCGCLALYWFNSDSDDARFEERVRAVLVEEGLIDDPDDVVDNSAWL